MCGLLLLPLLLLLQTRPGLVTRPVSISAPPDECILMKRSGRADRRPDVLTTLKVGGTRLCIGTEGHPTSGGAHTIWDVRRSAGN